MEVVVHKPFHHRAMRHIGADLNSIYGYLSMVVLVFVGAVLWATTFKIIQDIFGRTLVALGIFLLGICLTNLPQLLLVALAVVYIAYPKTWMLGIVGVIYFISMIAMFAK